MALDNINEALSKLRKDYEDQNKKFFNTLFMHKCQYDLSFDTFCKIIMANANNILLKRGMTHQFIIDRMNEQIMKQLYLYFIGSERCEWNIHAGIILAGKIGCGKTLLMTSYIQLANNMSRKQITAFHSDDLVLYIKEKGIKDIKDNPLFIDELGREQTEVKDFGNTMKPITDLIAKRYESGARTYATTNFARTIFTQRYGDYIGSRIDEMCNYILMPGESRRKAN